MKQILLIVMLICMTSLVALADNTNPIAIIDSPENFSLYSYIQGTVNIKGIVGFSSGANLNDPKGWVLEFGVGQSPTSWTELAHGHSSVGYPVSWRSPNSDASTFEIFNTWNTTTVTDGTYCVRLTVTDSANKTATDTHRYYVSNNISAPPPPLPTGPLGVPINGTYMYFTQNQLVAKSWTVTNGTIVLSGRKWVLVTWPNQGIGKIKYKTEGFMDSNEINIGIYNLTFSDKNTYNPGTVAENGEGQYQLISPAYGTQVNQYVIKAKSNKNYPAWVSNVTVTANGPLPPVGRDELLVGYIQNLNVSDRFANYSGVSGLSHQQVNSDYYLDQADGQNSPWGQYDYPIVRSFFDDNLDPTSTVIISMNDSPSANWPKWSDRPSTDINNNHPLTTNTHLRNFRTWVSSAPCNYDYNNESVINFLEADWQLCMAGDYSTGTWIPDHPIAGSAVVKGVWNSVVNQPVLSGTISSVRTNWVW